MAGYIGDMCEKMMVGLGFTQRGPAGALIESSAVQLENYHETLPAIKELKACCGWDGDCVLLLSCRALITRRIVQ